MTIDELQDLLNEVGDITIRFGYSGRGMNGAGCFGLVSGSTFLLRAMVEIAAADIELARELALRQCADSMGRDEIWYFPGVIVDHDTLVFV